MAKQTNDLTPTLIVDKNGKLTTVHKKHSTDASLMNAVPLPKLATVAPVDHRLAVKNLLAPAAAEFKDNHAAFFARIDDDTISYMHEVIVAGAKPDYFLGQLSCLMNDNVEPALMEAYLHLYDVHSDLPVDDMGEVCLLRGAIASGSPSPKNQTYDRTDAQRATEVANLYRFLYSTDVEELAHSIPIYDKTDNGLPASYYMLNNDALADYIKENPDQIEEIIKVASEHPERLDQRDKSGIEMIIKESRNWTVVSEGRL